MAWVEARRDEAESRPYDHLTGMVIGYIASVLTSVGILFAFLKNG